MCNPCLFTFRKINRRIIIPAILTGSMLAFFSCLAFADREISVPQNVPATNIFGKSKASFTGVYEEDTSRLNKLQKEARAYRSQGQEYQRIGDIDTAMAYYQKALEFDEAYAVVYNDLGIIYEIKNMPARAEGCYLKAIKINPYYLSAYSNLALFYENKRNLKKAAENWHKRAELGPVGDPWTEKARKRLEDIRLVLGNEKVNPEEDKVVTLMNDVMVQKAALKTDNKVLAKKHLEKAKLSFKKGDGLTAIKEAVDAKSCDPSNTEIDEFLDKVKLRMLSE